MNVQKLHYAFDFWKNEIIQYFHVLFREMMMIDELNYSKFVFLCCV